MPLREAVQIESTIDIDQFIPKNEFYELFSKKAAWRLSLRKKWGRQMQRPIP
jgi:hypothetical protein